MRVWFSKQRDGRYMLTREQPAAYPIGIRGPVEFYVPPGDALGFRFICDVGFKILTGLEPLEVGEQVRVKVNIQPAELLKRVEAFAA